MDGSLPPNVMRRRAARVLLALAGLLAWATPAAAVSVSPTALYIDSRTRTGVLTLFNSGQLAEELTLDFAFGYPRSDSAGVVTVELLDSVPAGEPAATAWLRAFPRRLVLQPGQRQVVRVMVQPPAGLADGEYWGRLVITSRGGTPPIEQRQAGVDLRLNVNIRTVMAVNYRNGAVSTGLRIAALEARRAADTVTAQVEMERLGNAAYLGRLYLEATDEGGRVVGRAWDDVAVYRGMRRRLAIPLEPGTRGPLRVRVRSVVEREDLPQDSLLPAAAATAEAPVQG